MGMHTSCLKTKVQNIGTGLLPAAVVVARQMNKAVGKFMYHNSDVDFSVTPLQCIRFAFSTLGKLDLDDGGCSLLCWTSVPRLTLPTIECSSMYSWHVRDQFGIEQHELD